MEKGRVLIVEDEKHLADGLRFNLEAEGYEVETVDNGEDALAKTAFDLVLLDVMLPGMNGFEVAQALRARGEIVPILMLTARSRPEDVLKGFAAGADVYLPKPFELGILMARVMAFCAVPNGYELPKPPLPMSSSFPASASTSTYWSYPPRASASRSLKWKPNSFAI